MKVTIDMCFILLIKHLINVSFTIVISCEYLSFHSFNGNGVHQKLLNEFNSLNSKVYSWILNNLCNHFIKGYKEKSTFS
jgi:hypothetical protein